MRHAFKATAILTALSLGIPALMSCSSDQADSKASREADRQALQQSAAKAKDLQKFATKLNFFDKHARSCDQGMESVDACKNVLILLRGAALDFKDPEVEGEYKASTPKCPTAEDCSFGDFRPALAVLLKHADADLEVEQRKASDLKKKIEASEHSSLLGEKFNDLTIDDIVSILESTSGVFLEFTKSGLRH
ncbi:hypothetical protein [Streptomyces sp. ODS05-4]|uniref:hypothetical protein n=1 Tax=Streptomyces sp. ODS05-4 TaxID=2944939 RepID=UPI00210AFEFB|nr:hypothetical protein [Streptomyces sp. ODS05-4]